jgi:predicted unusual protein kinase regulating ubiquinone biosynthesis (AarF/ABC1/UbiB family)
MAPSTRYRQIVVFFSKAALQLVLWEWLLPRLGMRGAVERTRAARLRRVAVGFRQLAIRMGGVLIKVGQFLSARVDVLPTEITSELAGLQDEVPPEPFADIRAVIERELGAPPAQRFLTIDEVPLAAASLGQVHRATLLSSTLAPEPQDPNAFVGIGEASGSTVARATVRPVHDALHAAAPMRVVIKVQRPNIETLIATDLAALRTVGAWLNRWPPIRRRASIPDLLVEFTRVLHEELDYRAEGRNAERFAENLEKRGGLTVPRVVWSHTTGRVLTLEDVFAIKITDYPALASAGIDRALVAQRLFRAYLQQIFQDGFFHADPHPGNLFVAPEEGSQRWRLVFVDFGMVGRLSPAARDGLREAAIAVGTRDAARLVRAQQMLGLLLPSARLDLVERAQALIFERLWGLTMADLQKISRQEMLDMLHDARELLYTLPFHLPEDLILLGRTLGILSGMCTGLNPQFNIWSELSPFARTLISEDSSPEWKLFLDEAWNAAAALMTIPRAAEVTLGKLNRSELALRIPKLEEQLGRLELTIRRVIGAVLCGAAVVGAVQLDLAGRRTHAAWLMGVALIALVWSATRRA